MTKAIVIRQRWGLGIEGHVDAVDYFAGLIEARYPSNAGVDHCDIDALARETGVPHRLRAR